MHVHQILLRVFDTQIVERLLRSQVFTALPGFNTVLLDFDHWLSGFPLDDFVSLKFRLEFDHLFIHTSLTSLRLGLFQNEKRFLTIVRTEITVSR